MPIEIRRKPGTCPVWKEKSVLGIKTKIKDLEIAGEIWPTGLDVSVGIRFKKRNDTRGVGIWHLRRGVWVKQVEILDKAGEVVPDPNIKKIPPTWHKAPDLMVEKFLDAVALTTAVEEAQALLMVKLFIESSKGIVVSDKPARMDSSRMWLRAEGSRLCARADKDLLMKYEDDKTKKTILELLAIRQGAAV